MSVTIKDLLDKNIAFISDDKTVHIICNDIFVLGADCEIITKETLPEFNQAVDDCFGNLELAAILYCARRFKLRPLKKEYEYIPRNLWPIFDACGPG